MITSPTFSRLCVSAAVLASLIAPATAQRGKPEFAWQGAVLLLDHGKPAYGRHSMDELEPGNRWRLGSNEASTMRVGAPLLGGDTMIAPGHYRVQLYRSKRDDQRFFLQVDGGGWGMGSEVEVGYLRASLSTASDVKKLEASWVTETDQEQKSPEKPPTRDVRLEVRFGPHRLDVPMTVMGSRESGKVGPYELVSYAVPADLLTKRMEREQPTVIASLRPRKKVNGRKQPPFFNLVVDAKRAKLVPALRAPVDSFGFGELEPFDPGWTQDVEIEWLERNERADELAITEAKVVKKQLTLTFSCGKKLGGVTMPLPRKPRD